MSKKFDLEKYKGHFVMCCETEEEANDFCRVLHEAGRKWSAGQSYKEDSYWYNPLHDTSLPIYYKFNEGIWSQSKWCCDGYITLFWCEFMNKEFTKADLRNGDVVLRRNGDVEIHIKGRFVDESGLACGSIYLEQDLTHMDDCGRDIMAVRRPNDISDMSFDAFEKELGRLVYERDETVEMTLEEVCKALGKNVKIVKGDK